MALEGLFHQIREEIPGYLAAAAGSFDGASFSSDGSSELLASKDALVGLVRMYHALYQGLGANIDFGSNDEVLISASRGFLLIRANHDRTRFVAVQLAASGNIGYLRFRMREYLRKVVAG